MEAPELVSFHDKRDFEIGCHALEAASKAQDFDAAPKHSSAPLRNRAQYKQSTLHEYMQTLKMNEEKPAFWATVGKRSRKDKFTEDCQDAKHVREHFGVDPYAASISNPQGKHAAPFARQKDVSKWVDKTGFDSTFGKRSEDDAMTMLRKQALEAAQYDALRKKEEEENVIRSRSAGNFTGTEEDCRKVLRRKEFQDLATQLLGPPKERFTVTFFNGRKMDASDRDAANYKELGAKWRETRPHPNPEMTRHDLLPADQEFKATFGKRSIADARSMRIKDVIEEARYDRSLAEKEQLPLYPFGDPFSSDTTTPPRGAKKDLSRNVDVQHIDQARNPRRHSSTHSKSKIGSGRRAIQQSQPRRRQGANSFLSAEVSVATTSYDVVPPDSAVEMAASLRGESSSRRPKPNSHHLSGAMESYKQDSFTK